MVKLTMKTLSLILSAASLLTYTSCTNMPAGVMQPGTQGYITQMGGKLELTMPSGAVAKIDNQKSFEKATSTIGTSINLITIAKAVDRMFDSDDLTTTTDAATAQNANNNSTALSTTQANNAHAENMAAMELEAAPTVVPTP
jgi:hypothetical protein